MTSEPPAGAPGADTPADGGSVVAMLLGDGLQLDPRAGTPRLPRVPDTDWDDHEERLLGHPTAVPMAPAHGLAGPPGAGCSSWPFVAPSRSASRSCRGTGWTTWTRTRRW